MLVPRICDNRIKKSVDDIDASRRVTQRGVTVKIALNMWDGHMPQQRNLLKIYLNQLGKK